MTTTILRDGSHQVKIVEDLGRYTSRLYVNRGETACETSAKAMTLAGALKQAQRMLARVSR